MINRPIWMEMDSTYPYRNLAMEGYMTLYVLQGTCILYPWQNRHMVVIGKNQSCWKEYRMDFLEQEDGYLVRRLSGGGAVLHDLGNLNFTFIIGAESYDVSRRLDVILGAVKNLRIYTEKTGRNDITMKGHKSSGNAFYRIGNGCYRHDTILVWAGKGNMSRYLNVSREKLASEDVTSVESRVVNLYELEPDTTSEEMKVALVEAFFRVYEQPAVGMKEEELPQPEIDVLTEKFTSWQWKYGRKVPFEYEMERQSPWGDIQIRLHADEGVIQDMNVSSDAMNQEMFGALARQLKGCGYAKEDTYAVVEAMRPDAFQAEEHTSTDAPRSRQTKEGIRALAREPL